MVGISNGSAGQNTDERKTLAEIKDLNLGMGEKASSSIFIVEFFSPSIFILPSIMPDQIDFFNFSSLTSLP